MTGTTSGRAEPPSAARARRGQGFPALVHVLAAAAAGVIALGAAVPFWIALLVALAAGLPALLVRRPRGGGGGSEGGDGPYAAAIAAESRRGEEARALMLGLDADRSRSVLESLREGVLVVDDAGEILLANPAARAALRGGGPEHVGRRLFDVLAPELEASVRQGLLATGDRQAPGELSFRISSIACRDRVFDMTAVRVRSRASGHTFGTAFLFVDSTRSHEVAQLKDRFLSSISHEFRTPLTNICAYAEILRRMPPGESGEWPEFVRIIHEEGLQLGRLVDAVLDFLQLESGDARFAPEEVDCGEVAQAACARARERAGLTGTGLEFVAEAAGQRAVVDRGRYAQVCEQLIDNGLRFAPPGGRVRVRVTAADGNPCLRVEDSGPGVPVGERSAVFEEFGGRASHLTDRLAGAGLGLATCRAIVARMGGLIWCEESELGGAAFVVVLPRAGGGARLEVPALTGGE